MPSSFHRNWLALTLICSSPVVVLGQQPRNPLMPAPPPMKFVSRDERSQLTAARDAKSRVKLTIELAEQHLKHAEDLTGQKKFEPAAEELGSYLGLIDDAREFIGGMDPEKNSTRDLYRRLDISLRAHVPRLAVMRRITPAEYAVNLKAAEAYTREARTEVLESFYGHTVLRDDPNQKKPASQRISPKNNHP